MSKRIENEQEQEKNGKCGDEEDSGPIIDNDCMV